MQEREDTKGQNSIGEPGKETKMPQENMTPNPQVEGLKQLYHLSYAPIAMFAPMRTYAASVMLSLDWFSI